MYKAITRINTTPIALLKIVITTTIHSIHVSLRVDQNPSISHTQINQTVSHIITMNDYYPLANSANTLCQAVDLLVASCNKMAPITVSVLLSPPSHSID